MADEVNWPVEDIPDEDGLYMRAHKKFFPQNILQPGVFREHDGGMSVDWSKYSAPADTRACANNPSANAVICLLAGQIRSIQSLTVVHDPQPSNRAHSNVDLPDHGENLTEARLELLRHATVVLPLSSPD